MAHCAEEEADVAVAEISLASAQTAEAVAQIVFDLADMDLMECELEH